MWMVISSITAFLSFTDLGIGNGLLNAVASAHGAGDGRAVREHISSAFFLLLGLAMLLGLSFAVAYPWINWPVIFNVASDLARAEAGPAVAIFVLCFLLHLPLDTIKRIQFGLQEGFRNSLWNSLGSLIGLAGVLLVIYLEAGLVWLVLALCGAPIVATVVNGVALFGRRYRGLLPKPRLIRLSSIKLILETGTLFVILQMAVALAFASDNMVAAQILGSAAVAHYAVAKKLFDMVGNVLKMILSPLWPAYGEAAARGDMTWIRSTLTRSVIMTAALSLVPSVILVFAGHWIIRAWVGPEIAVPTMLLVGFAIWTVFSSVGNAVAMFMNGINRIGFQAKTALALAITALVAKILLAEQIGLAGIIFGTNIAYFVCTLIPFTWYTPKLLAELESDCDEAQGVLH
jgi:O-antigen/teichoic acid export membrane protein